MSALGVDLDSPSPFLRTKVHSQTYTFYDYFREFFLPHLGMFLSKNND